MRKISKSLINNIPSTIRNFTYYAKGDCIKVAKRYFPDNLFDLLITDPPYGIEGDKLHKHYNRDEDHVIPGYVEVDKNKYEEFTSSWIKEANRVLKPGGSLYVFSGWSNLRYILNALIAENLEVVNHIIWKYNFGVNTRLKYVTSHYHILYVVKPGEKPTFNTFSRFSPTERTDEQRSMLYEDLEDVWKVNRVYKNGHTKNKNELPEELIIKILQYSSKEGDLIGDFFAGSFVTAKMARALKRNSICIELNDNACKYAISVVKQIKWGEKLKSVLNGKDDRPMNEGKPWTTELITSVTNSYLYHRNQGQTKIGAIRFLQSEFERGYFSIINILKKVDVYNYTPQEE